MERDTPKVDGAEHHGELQCTLLVVDFVERAAFSFAHLAIHYGGHEGENINLYAVSMYLARNRSWDIRHMLV